MGTKLKEIIERKELTLEDLRGKIIVIDTYNILYQFLATIRQPDGTPLTDSHGNITSHLAGLFNRTARLMQAGVKPAFVFDGKPPELKMKERERRNALKETAHDEYEIAKGREDIESMKKYAQRTMRLTREMADEAKELIKALGLPIIQAESEGEAQAAYMVKKGDAYASVSQDYDSLLFGTPRLIQNLTITERKKLAGKLAYQDIKPELIELKKNLDQLKITQDKLIILGILVGTDYNYGGIKGIGPKKALKLVQEREDYDKIFEELKWSEHFQCSWKEVFDTIKEMKYTDDYDLRWQDPDVSKLKALLCDKHDFSQARVDSAIEKLIKEKEKKAQKGLSDFFK